MGGGMGGGGSPFDVGKSKSKLELEPNTGVTFEDVAGCEESKRELVEVVDFLKNPVKFTKVGAKSPRGVLLEGPPGTGKTLLARAIAGEAGVPFTSASGSEFVEMFVGVGASRVRDLFKKAKDNAPCIIFIDEIDAIGRQRAGASNGGMGGGNDEREQTLNQILTEMDGFEGNSGVIVVAATNRGDVLDNALLRPGRFDRRVPVGLPDKDGRVEILKVHCKGKPLAEGVNLETIAARTTGFSGAQLQNLMNESAIYAARSELEAITFKEIDQAIDRVTVGLAKRTGMSNEKRQRLVAYHEAGHALMGVMTPEYDPVAKITILPRSNGAGGFTLFVPNEDRMDGGMYSLRYLKAQLAVALGGRVAEELIFGEDEVTTGASNDLQQVRSIARRMVTQWGFAGDNLGMTAWESADGSGPYGRTNASEEKEAAIDAEVSKLCQEAYETTMATLKEHKNVMDELVTRLLEKETVDGFEFAELVEKMTGKPAPAYAAIPKSVEESLKAQRAMEGMKIN
jgi:cell division protease FtsH